LPDYALYIKGCAALAIGSAHLSSRSRLRRLAGGSFTRSSGFSSGRACGTGNGALLGQFHMAGRNIPLRGQGFF